MGITFWESPERKCLNECHLPLPPLLQAPAAAGHEGTAAAMSSVASASTATAASGVGDGDGGHQAPAEGGEKPDGNSGGVGAADAGRSGQVRRLTAFKLWFCCCREDNDDHGAGK